MTDPDTFAENLTVAGRKISPLTEKNAAEASPHFPPDHASFHDSGYSRICEILLWYEKTWAPDRPIPLEEAIRRGEGLDEEELFEQLLKIDLTLGAENGTCPTPEEYIARFPEYEALIRTVCEQTANERPLRSRFRPGHTLGHYQLLERIGQGGMGIVYKAFDTQMERTVAIKYISPQLQQDQEGFEQFQLEMKLLGRLARHENIVQGFACDSDGGTPYFVMEFIDGVDLHRYITEPPPVGVHRALDAAEAANITLQIARGLDHIHRNGMIHRDVKPANIMRSPDGRVRLCDLGLGLFVGRRESQATGADARIGTPGYLAPETEFDGQTPDERSDMFSLGVTLFFLLTAQSPSGLFDGAAPHRPTDPITLEALQKRFRQTGRKVPSALLNLLRRMTARQPQERCASMEEVIHTLEKIFPSLEEQSRRRKNRWTAALILALLAAVGIGIGTTFHADQRAAQVEPIPLQKLRADSLAQIRRQLAQNRISEASALLDEARTNFSSDPEFLFLEGKIGLKSENFATAQEAFTRAIGHWSQDAEKTPPVQTPFLQEAEIDRVLAQIGQNQDAEGIVVLTELLKNPGENRYPLLLLRGMCRSRVGYVSDAAADFDAAIESDPENPFGYRQRAAHYFQNRQLKRALNDTEFSLARNPENPDARFLRALLFLDLARYQEALADFDFLLKKIPNAPFLYSRRALCHEHLNNAEQARLDTEKYTELMASDHPVVLVPGAFASIADWTNLIQSSDRNLW